MLTCQIIGSQVSFWSGRFASNRPSPQQKGGSPGLNLGRDGSYRRCQISALGSGSTGLRCLFGLRSFSKPTTSSNQRSHYLQPYAFESASSLGLSSLIAENYTIAMAGIFAASVAASTLAYVAKGQGRSGDTSNSSKEVFVDNMQEQSNDGKLKVSSSSLDSQKNELVAVKARSSEDSVDFLKEDAMCSKTAGQVNAQSPRFASAPPAIQKENPEKEPSLPVASQPNQLHSYQTNSFSSSESDDVQSKPSPQQNESLDLNSQDAPNFHNSIDSDGDTQMQNDDVDNLSSVSPFVKKQDPSVLSLINSTNSVIVPSFVQPSPQQPKTVSGDLGIVEIDEENSNNIQKERVKTSSLAAAAYVASMDNPDIGGGSGGDDGGGSNNSGGGGGGENFEDNDDFDDGDEWDRSWLLQFAFYLVSLPAFLQVHKLLYQKPQTTKPIESTKSITHEECMEEVQEVQAELMKLQLYLPKHSEVEEAIEDEAYKLPEMEMIVEWSSETKPSVTEYLQLMRLKDLEVIKKEVEKADQCMNIEELGTWGVMWRTIVPATAAFGLFFLGRKGNKNNGGNKEGKFQSRGITSFQQEVVEQIPVHETGSQVVSQPARSATVQEDTVRLTERTHMLQAEIKAHESVILVRNEEVGLLQMEVEQAKQKVKQTQARELETSQKLLKAEENLADVQAKLEQEISGKNEACQTIETLSTQLEHTQQEVQLLLQLLDQEALESQLAITQFDYVSTQLETKAAGLRQVVKDLQEKLQAKGKEESNIIDKHFSLINDIRNKVLDVLDLNTNGEEPQDIDGLVANVLEATQGFKALKEDFERTSSEVKQLTRKRQEYEFQLKEKELENSELKGELEEVQKMLGILKREYSVKAMQLTQMQGKQVELHRQLERSTQELDRLTSICSDVGNLLDEKQTLLKQKSELEQKLRIKDAEIVRLEYEQQQASDIMRALNMNLADRGEDIAEFDNSVENLRRKNRTLHRKLTDLSKAQNTTKLLKNENEKLKERKSELERMLTNKQNQSDRYKAEKESSDHLLEAYKSRDSQSNQEVISKLEKIKESSIKCRKIQRQLSNQRTLAFLTNEEKSELVENVEEREAEIDMILKDIETIMRERSTVMSQIDELKADNKQLYSRMRNMSNSLVDRVNRSTSFIEGKKNRGPARSVTSMNLASKVIEADLLKQSSQKLDKTQSLPTKRLPKRASFSGLSQVKEDA